MICVTELCFYVETSRRWA